MDIEKAKRHLKNSVTPEGDLFDLSWYLRYDAGDDTATLDGDFEADDLEAIASYMRSKIAETENSQTAKPSAPAP